MGRDGESNKSSPHGSYQKTNDNHKSVSSASAYSTIKPTDTRRLSKSMDTMKEQHEASPLISPTRRSEDSEQMTSVGSPDDIDWTEDPLQETKSSWYLLLLTLAIGGLQIAWSVELSYGSPYLLGLGISKSLLALVWIAGPLSGVLVQPYVGIRSDRSRSKWGRRRPFMAGGALVTIVSLICLAWAREIVATVLGIFGVDQQAKAINTVAIVFAILLIYILDFAINTSKC